MSRAPWHPAYVALGSNLDDPTRQVREALGELSGLSDTRLVSRSALYASPPVGPPGQPDYVNAVAGLLTRQEPEALLASLRAIEQAHHRDRSGPRWGPRTLDLDLLMYGDREVETDALTLPHPRMHERAFVLVPLAEIAPVLRIPRRGRVAALAAGCDTTGLRLMGKP